MLWAEGNDVTISVSGFPYSSYDVTPFYVSCILGIIRLNIDLRTEKPGIGFPALNTNGFRT